METAVNPWKSKWGRIMWMFELWEIGYHLELIYWICNTKHLSLFLHVSLRLVSAGWDDEEEKFFRTEASEVTNGCFLCVMKREVRKMERERIRFFLNIYKGIFTAIKTCCDSYLVLKCVCVRWWESSQTHTLLSCRAWCIAVLNTGSVAPVCTK